MELYTESVARHWPSRASAAKLHSEMLSVAKGFLVEWIRNTPAVDVIPYYYVRQREVRDAPKKFMGNCN